MMFKYYRVSIGDSFYLSISKAISKHITPRPLFPQGTNSRISNLIRRRNCNSLEQHKINNYLLKFIIKFHFNYAELNIPQSHLKLLEKKGISSIVPIKIQLDYGIKYRQLSQSKIGKKNI